ncbi:hypothetical protein RRG08_000578 [Elysia crispata]|uniref:Dehydrogenase/reductase SDR family member 7 n=1 Tax=Elysia crispata TaxID=231223 RepID=A0AAE0Y8K8_9GAST|nr:hypothetical protein RRG08_000578 [Elysia crispata]
MFCCIWSLFGGLWSLFQVATVLVLLLTILCVAIIIRSDADILTILYERLGNKPESLAGKVVWVTGASAGIGEYLVYQLTQIGCKVIISARREEQLQKVKDACLASAKCQTKADDICILPLDVSQCDTHKDAVQTVIDKFGHIDILLNNAGRGMRGKWWEIDMKVDKDMWELNVLGTVSLTRNVLPHMMKRRQGHVAVISSTVGLVAPARCSAYSGAKHAVQGYFGNLRHEMFEYGIDVTLICPGPVHSEFQASQLTHDGNKVGRVTNPNRMSTERCAFLSLVAIANRMYESWVSTNPLLIIIYTSRYLPNLTEWFLTRRAVKIMVEREGDC